MQNYEILLVIVVMMVATFITRALPFYVVKLFKANEFINYLSRMMPACVVFTLVIYSFKDLDFLRFPYGLPEILAALLVIVLQLIFKNALLSIIAGLIFFYGALSFTT